MKDTDLELLVMNGGRPLMKGGAVSFNFGYMPSEGDQLAGAADFDPNEDTTQITEAKCFLWDYMRAYLGSVPPMNWQLSGSCVNGGFQDAFMARQCVELCVMPQPEVFIRPYTLWTYGQARTRAYGSTGEGEGCDGSIMADTAAVLGVPSVDDPDVPKPHICGPALVYDRPVEMKWSGSRNHPAGVRERAKQFNIEYGKVGSADEARAEVRRGRPLTFCGMWGGSMSPRMRGTGENAVLFNTHDAEWSHQQACLATWDHPTLGLIFWIQNQWYRPGRGMSVTYIRTSDGQAINLITNVGEAISVFGDVGPNGIPGGYWISAADMSWQCKYGAVRSIKKINSYTKGPLKLAAA